MALSETVTEMMLPGRVDRETEFTHGLTGACGPNASAMAQRWADQAAAAAVNTYTVYQRMRAAGLCAVGGAATLSALATDAARAGYHVSVLPYREPMAEGDWRGFFDAHVGQRAMVYETANGQALRDYLTGAGENATNLHYHFIMLAGWHPGGWSERAQRELPAGWWCADGDNYDVGDVLQFYPDTVIAASKPCAAMAVYARVRFAEMGWTMSADGKTAHDSGMNGARHSVGAGLGVLLVNARAADGKRSETPYNGIGDVFVTLTDERVATWTHAHGASFEQGALVIEAREDEIATLKQQVADLKKNAGGGGSSGGAGGDDVAVDAIKSLAVALATVR